MLYSFNMTVSYEDYQKIEIRVGKILAVEDFPEAHQPKYKLTIDFGPEVGIKKSAAGIVEHYKKEELVGKLVVGVVNFPAKQIGPFMSEVLTLGLPDENGKVVLVSPDSEVPLGGRLF